MAPVCSLANDASLAFSAQNVDNVDETLFEPGKSLMDAVNVMDLGTQEERDFLATYPAQVLDQIRDEIYAHLTTAPRTPLVFSWVQTGNYEVVTTALSQGKSITIGGPAH